MKYAFGMLVFALLFGSCAQDREGKLVKEVDFPEGEYPDYDFSVGEEKELCDLLDKSLIQKHFEGADNFTSTGLRLSQYGSNNGGCRLAWTPEKSISRQKVGNYFHASSEGSIELKFNKNAKPGNIERFAQRSLTQKVKPPKDNEYINELDFDYYKVNGVGSYAVWNDGTSTLEFAIGDNHLYSLSVKYPLPAEERKNIAKELAQAFISQTK